MSLRFLPQAFNAELLFPPLNYVDREVKQFYLDVSEGFYFTQFELLEGGKGANFGGKGQQKAALRSDRLKFDDQQTLLTYNEWADQTKGFISAAKERFKIPVFITQAITMRVLIPLDNQKTAIDFFHENFLSLQRDQFSHFGRPLAGIGLRFVFPPVQNEQSEIQVRLEPYLRDKSMIYLESIYRSFLPISGAEQLAPLFEKAYRFLDENFGNFFQELNSTPPTGEQK